MRSAGEYVDHCDQLFGDFTPDQIKQLYKHLGADMDWELFFARLNAVDDLARLVLEVWEGDLNRLEKRFAPEWSILMWSCSPVWPGRETGMAGESTLS